MIMLKCQHGHSNKETKQVYKPFVHIFSQVTKIASLGFETLGKNLHSY